MMVISFAVFASISYLTEATTVAFIAALLAAVAAYFVLALLFGAVRREDILMLPFGEKIALIIENLGFWRSRCNKI